jgi:LysM repeat protein
VVALFGLGCGGVGEPFYIDFREMQPRLHMEPRVRAEPRAGMGARVHVVAAEGESVCVLAGRYGVAAPALLRANGLTASDRALARGTQVRLPPEPLRHRIAQGETLADLARWYGLPVTRLARANGISDPDRIDADHWLRVPAGARTGCAPATAVAQAPAQPTFAAQLVPEVPPAAEAQLVREVPVAAVAQPVPEITPEAAAQPVREVPPAPAVARAPARPAFATQPAPEVPPGAAAQPVREVPPVPVAQPAAEEEPSYEEARRTLARAQSRYDAADFGEALEFATSSQRLLEPHAGGAEADRLRAHAFWISGLVYTGLGRTESAVTAFRTALELVPSLADQEAMSPKVRTLVEFARIASVAGPP